MQLPASIATLAALGLLAASAAAEESVHQAFQRGASLFPEVQIESLDGGVLKTDFIAAIAKYLTLLDDEIERLFAWGVRELVQEATARARDIGDIIESLPTSSDILDYELMHMTDIFREVREIRESSGLDPCGFAPARQGEGNTRSHSLSPRQVLTRRAPRRPQQQGGRAVYSVRELCADLHGTMIRPDLATLHTWVERVLGEGERAVEAAAFAIQYQKREKHLLNLVTMIQGVAVNLQRYDSVLYAHTSPAIWAEFVYERNHLLLC